MIKVQNLVKRFGTKYALDDVSFSVEKGEVVGFLGPNGAGKSTTMNIITGFMSSTSGSAEVAGIDILDDPIAVKRYIGYLPEQPPLYPDMTVKEYLNFVYELKGCRLNRRKHLEEICKVVKIADDYKRGRLIKNLSKGYKQRVGIAQALVGNPSVIILDEPTVGLDPKEIIEIRALIRNLGETHTVILSTHILSEVQAVCDRIIIINSGKIIADEKAESIFNLIEDNRRYNVRICGQSRAVQSELERVDGISRVSLVGEREGDSYLYSVECASDIDIRKAIFAMCAAKNMPLIGLELQGVSLEDVFIALVDKKKNGVNDHRKTKTGFDVKDAANYEIKEDNN